jgi:hypothetical protein
MQSSAVVYGKDQALLLVLGPKGSNPVVTFQDQGREPMDQLFRLDLELPPADPASPLRDLRGYMGWILACLTPEHGGQVAAVFEAVRTYCKTCAGNKDNVYIYIHGCDIREDGVPCGIFHIEPFFGVEGKQQLRDRYLAHGELKPYDDDYDELLAEEVLVVIAASGKGIKDNDREAFGGLLRMRL